MQTSASTDKFMQHLAYSDSAWRAGDSRIGLKKDFDRPNVSYIA